MAINLTNAGAANVGRDGSFLDLTTDWTVAFWLWQGATTPSGGASRVHWEEDSNGGAGPEYLLLGFVPNSNSIRLELYDGVTTSNSSAVTPTASTWYYTAITYVAATTTISFYTSGTLRGTIVADLSAISWGTLSESINAVGWRDQAQAYTRSWQRVLSGAQLTAESLSITPVLTTNLLTNTPFTGPTDLSDTTANGEDWTLAAGTLAFLAGPLAPPNLTGGTATDVGSTLPVTLTEDISGATATLYAVWFTYTATFTGVLGVWALGDLTSYTARITVYAGGYAGGDLYLGGMIGSNVPVQFPVTSGVVYYCKVDSPAHTTGALTLTLQRHTAVAAPQGSLFVPDDTPGFPAAILSSTDGTVETFVLDFSAGEGGDILPNGTMLVEDVAAGNCKVYSLAYALVATVTTPYASGNPTIRSNKVDTFYVGTSEAATAKIRQVSAAGVILDTWILTNPIIEGLAPSNDETLIYVTGQAGRTDPTIKIWNTGTDSFGANLTAGVAGHLAPEDLLVMDDDTIVTVFDKLTATKNTTLVSYNMAGVVQNSTDYGSAVSTFRSRLAYDLDDPDVFWLWRHLGTGFSRFSKINLSDFTVLATFDRVTFEEGIYEGTATLTPDAHFGHSHSCPFLLTRSPVTPPVTTTSDPIRFVRIFPHMNHSQMLLFVSRLEIEMQRGVGLISGQGADPAFLVSASHDGGLTYSPERFISPGKMGEYLKRAYALRWGRARDFVFKVVVTDPVHLALAAIYLDVEEASS